MDNLMISYAGICFIVFFPAIIIFGGAASYYDIHFGIIKNKWIVASLAYAGAVYLMIWLFFFFFKDCERCFFFVRIYGLLFFSFHKWCINLFISSIVAFILWRQKMWAAGDAKLFIGFVALTPIMIYPKAYFHYYFASFYLLLAIFFPASAFILIKTLISVVKNIEIKNFSLTFQEVRKIDVKRLLKIGVGFYGFFLLFKVLRRIFEKLLHIFIPDHNIVILLSIALFKQLSTFFERNMRTVIIVSTMFVVLEAYLSKGVSVKFFLEILSIGFKTVIVMGVRALIVKFVENYQSNNTTFFAPWIFLGVLITWCLGAFA